MVPFISSVHIDHKIARRISLHKNFPPFRKETSSLCPFITLIISNVFPKAQISPQRSNAPVDEFLVKEQRTMVWSAVASSSYVMDIKTVDQNPNSLCWRIPLCCSSSLVKIFTVTACKPNALYKEGHVHDPRPSPDSVQLNLAMDLCQGSDPFLAHMLIGDMSSMIIWCMKEGKMRDYE